MAGREDAFLVQAWAGAAATASGNGLARFAFVPLFPAMVAAGWVNGAEAGTLGALTLLGSLIGSLGGRRMALRGHVPALLDIGMGVILLSLLSCAWNVGMWWLSLWRFFAGVGGGILMALAGPAAVAAAPMARKGIVGGIVVAGVGLGIAGGALAIPVLLFGGGVAGGWAGLAGLVGALWLLARGHWPATPPTNAGSKTLSNGRSVLVTYSLHSAGMVPPMVYLADLAVRGHHLDVEIGALLWFAFGLAGVAGGMLAGRLTDCLDSRRVLKGLLVIQAIALAFCLTPSTALILLAAALAGFVAVGTTTIVLSLAQEIGGLQATLLWVRCTAAFSIVQAAVGFMLAGLFVATDESHIAIFGAGLAFSVVALLSTRWV